MNLMDAADLPKSSLSDGPETWGEAFGKLIFAGDDVQKVIENMNSDYSAMERAYDQRIAAIADLTGQTLPNPMRVASGVDRDMAGVLAASAGGGSTLSPGDLSPEYRRRQEEEFNAKARQLAERYPQVNDIIASGIDEEKNRAMLEAQRTHQRANASPALDPVSRFTAELIGGVMGAARDPWQWGMSIFGAPSAGGSVAGRIGKTMVTEALLNSGQELVLQAASQERKRKAGLEHGMKDMLANAGIAAIFGMLFGGTIQGGAELARLFKLGDGGAERAARVLAGEPRPGDVETLAKAMGGTLDPDQLAMLNRSFEERVLDDAMISADAPPERQRVLEAALRHAEDPDNFPPPDVVERLIADEARGPARSHSADEYERVYAGDPNAIDDIRRTMTAEPARDAPIDQPPAAIAERGVNPAPADLPPIIEPQRLDQIARSARPLEKKPRSPQSLMDFLAAEGGIREQGGELTSIGLSRKFVPGRGALVRSNGKHLDYAREAAAQAGYFNHIYGTADEASAKSTVADLLDLLDQENRGTKAYSMADAGRVAALKEFEDRLATRTEFREFLGKLEVALREVAPDAAIDDAVLARATALMIEEDLTPLAAFDRAVLEDEARFADYMEDSGQGYRDDPAYADIPFFDDEATTASSARRSAGNAKQDGAAGRRQANDQNSDQSPHAGEAARDGVAPSDPLDGLTIRPDRGAEPMDDAAMRQAEESAGDIVDPVLDANGNPENLLDLIPLQDGDGNVRLVTTREALAAADEDNFLADVLEACKT